MKKRRLVAVVIVICMMHFEIDQVYHVYNRGNDRTPIFFRPENYLYFLRKVRHDWLPFCDLFCYCLMPNHFHFTLLPKLEGCEEIMIKDRLSHMQKLSKAIGKTLSSYTRAINIQNKTRGNLFQKKTKEKCLTLDNCDEYYLKNCFHYIHNNPLKAGLVNDLKDWPYSSWPDYYGYRNGTLCNKQLAMARMGLSPIDFVHRKVIEPDKKIIELIW